MFFNVFWVFCVFCAAPDTKHPGGLFCAPRGERGRPPRKQAAKVEVEYRKTLCFEGPKNSRKTPEKRSKNTRKTLEKQGKNPKEKQGKRSVLVSRAWR